MFECGNTSDQLCVAPGLARDVTLGEVWAAAHRNNITHDEKVSVMSDSDGSDTFHEAAGHHEASPDHQGVVQL